MLHERVAPDTNIIQAGHLFRGIVHTLIRAEPDPAEKKARILIAREHGHLSDEDAEEWIVLAGLVDA